jgi:hypothetical protein
LGFPNVPKGVNDGIVGREAFVDGCGTEFVDLERFGAASDDELHLFWTKQLHPLKTLSRAYGEGVAATDKVESALKGFELLLDGRVEYPVHVLFHVELSVVIGNGSGGAMFDQLDAHDMPVGLVLDYKVATIGFFHVAFVL